MGKWKNVNFRNIAPLGINYSERSVRTAEVGTFLRVGNAIGLVFRSLTREKNYE